MKRQRWIISVAIVVGLMITAGIVRVGFVGTAAPFTDTLRRQSSGEEVIPTDAPSLLTGNGSSTGNSPQATTNGTASNEEGEASAGAKTRITIGLAGADSVHPPMIIKAFREQHPHIIVDTVSLPWDDFFDRLLLMLVTDTAPDVWYGEAGRAALWFDAGFTADVKPFAQRDLHMDDYFFLEAAADPVTGAWTGIPGDFQVTSLFYNTEHFLRSGLPFPDEHWTRDDLVTAARVLTRHGIEETEQWGFAMQPEYMTAGWMLWTKLLGGHILDESRRASLLNSAETVDALTTMHSYIHEFGITPPPQVHGFTPWGAVDTFHRGVTSMMFNIYTWNRYLQEGDMTTYDVAMVPSLPNGERITTAVPNVWVINARAPHAQQEAAWEWITFQIGEEAQKIRMAEGSGVPVNRKLTWDFVDLPAPPENRDIYLDSFAFAVTLEENPLWDDYRRAIEEALLPLWHAEKTPPDVALDAHRKVEEILKDLS